MDVAADPRVLQADIEAMGLRIGELSEKNFKLEEQVNALLNEIAHLNDELAAKSRIIRFVFAGRVILLVETNKTTGINLHY